MKRLLLSLISMLVIGSAWADDDRIVLSIPNVEVPQGGSVQVPINITNTVGVKSFQADITLNGINLNIGDIQMSDLVLADRTSNIAYTYWVDKDGNEYNEYDETKTLTEKTGITAFTVESNYPEVDGYKAFRFLGFNMKSVFMSGTEGAAAYFTIAASDNVEIGKTYTAKIVSASGSSTGSSIVIPDQSFTITVVENRVTLDETVGVPSETPTEPVNVLVKRSITAGNWSTICLPFAMTSDQVKAAFGDGISLADFVGCECDGDKDNASKYIRIKFNSVDAIEANHPYLIKVDEAITEFNVDGVTLVADEENAIIQRDKTSSGRNLVYNNFVGTYTPNTIIPNGSLFLNGNKFYYSKGNSKLDAFRGYFDFSVSYLEDALDPQAKINLIIDGETNSIEGLRMIVPVEGVYDLSGRKIKFDGDDFSRLPKGVYIVNGKKVTVK